MKDVAKQAGVSKQTVSRVINNHADVAYSTRIHVEEIIDRLGYKPNALARGLSAKQSFTIGFISSRLEYYGPRSLLMAIDANAHRVGYRVFPYILHEDRPSEIEDHLRSLIALQPDGIIWEMAVRIEDQFLTHDIAELSSLPMITLNGNIQGIHNVLDIEDTEASRKAVEHLVRQGYKNIGIITGPSNWYTTEQRFAGWKVALQEHGLPTSSAQIVEGDWTAASGKQGISQLLKQFPTMDAVFVSNDQMALGALSELHDRDIRIPQDIGIVGYDDVEEAAYYTPSLTTVHQPYDLYGKELIQILVKMIEDNVNDRRYTAPEPIHVTPELIIRESSQKSLGEI